MFVLCDHLFIMKLNYKDIRLRKLRWSDAQAIYEYACLDSVCELTQEEKHYSIEDTYDSIENYHFLYQKRNAFSTMVIEYKNNVVGLIALHTKITNKYKIKKIVSEVLKNNKVSIHLLEKFNFECISENEKELYYERKF